MERMKKLFAKLKINKFEPNSQEINLIFESLVKYNEGT